MSKIVEFPRKETSNSLGVRSVPSANLPGFIEVQRLYEGAWQTLALFRDEYDAQQYAGEQVVSVIKARSVLEDIDSGIPF